jgi:hypothetical protein
MRTHDMSLDSPSIVYWASKTWLRPLLAKRNTTSRGRALFIRAQHGTYSAGSISNATFCAIPLTALALTRVPHSAAACTAR